MALFNTDDFSDRMNFKISPSFQFQVIAVIGMLVNFVFCFIWEMYVLDGIFFQKVLPWYKENIRGPHLEFEHLEHELMSCSSWPPLDKNNGRNSGEKYPGYPLPDVAAGITSKNQFRHQLTESSANIKEKFMRGSSKNLRKRSSDDSNSATELIREGYENPESTPVHITTNQFTENEELHTSIGKLITQYPDQKSNQLSDLNNEHRARGKETAC